MNTEIEVGQRVKFAAVIDPGDEAAPFTVLEVNGDRLLVRFVCDMPIAPTQVVGVQEVVPATD